MQSHTWDRQCPLVDHGQAHPVCRMMYATALAPRVSYSGTEDTFCVYSACCVTAHSQRFLE